MKIKALFVEVFSNPLYRGCANGGVSERYDSLYVACPEGNYEVEDTNPRLVKLEANAFGTIKAVPLAKVKANEVGYMFGGSYISTSDSRFSDMCEQLLGHPFYGAVALHDRTETYEEYDILSR